MSELSAVFGDWMVDTITVRPFLGEGSGGPVLGPPETIEGVMLTYKTKLVRQGDTSEALSDAQIMGELELAPKLAAGGEVTLPNGERRTIHTCQPEPRELPHVQALLV